jgi:hypothetical protein
MKLKIWVRFPSTSQNKIITLLKIGLAPIERNPSLKQVAIVKRVNALGYTVMEPALCAHIFR